MTQNELLSRLSRENKDAVIVSSLGSISYDLKEIEHPNKILIKGAMGAALSCGLGYAMGSDKEVIVVIGDGAFLMKAGSVATILKHDLKNLRIIVLNNGIYKSCGNQKTNFEAIQDLVPFEIYKV